MQKNCHEFIAYENLVGARRQTTGGRARTGGTPAADLDKALPLVKRALKVLSDREVTPQLGLLKSTLLQLDSTFSERDYGASTFRDFIEKVAERGIVTLKQSGRSVLVELADSAQADAVSEAPPISDVPVDSGHEGSEPREIQREDRRPEGEPRPIPSTEEATEAVKLAARLFEQAKQPPRWPMYIRQIRQYLRNSDESFDERKLGFAGIVEFLRACQRDGLLRLERDRQGVMRVFPGPAFPKPGVQQSEAQPASESGSSESMPEPTFESGEAGETLETEPRFRRVTDDEATPMVEVIDAVAIETPRSASDEEDLSVGPGNVAGRETHTMTTTAKVGRGAGRKGVVRAPRKPAGPSAARGPRVARSRKAVKS
jgi:hypothetical protein